MKSPIRLPATCDLSPADYPHTTDRLTRMLILAFVTSGTEPEAAVRITTSLQAAARAESAQGAMVKVVLR